jgi:hypothetical protein
VETAVRPEASIVVSSVRARWRQALWWLVGLLVLVGFANLLVLLDQAHALIRDLYLNADNASALVLPALAGHAPPGAVVNLGNHPWYEPWLFMRATAGLPGYRGLWEAAPFVFGLLGIAVVSVCAWWVLGRLAGLLCTVALLATSETLRGILYVPEAHGAILLHVGVLGAALLIVHRAALQARRRRGVLLAVGVPLTVFTAAGLTDQLLLVSGVVPFVLAPLLCWERSRSRVWLTVGLFAVVTGALSVLLSVVLSEVMQEQGVIHAAFPIAFLSSEAIFVDLGNLLATFAGLGGGAFFGASASGTSLLTFLAGALTLCALAVVLRAVWRWSRARVRSAGPLSPPANLRELFIAYWALVLAVVLAAFALTSVASNTSDGRYLIAAWAAIAALLGILATTPAARIALIVAVALFGALNVRAELANGVTPAGPGPSLRIAGAIEHFAIAHDATIGYSGYWEAAPVTWQTRLRVQVRPIVTCPVPAGFCPFYANNISTWYAAQPGIRTFLLTDTRQGVPGEVTAPPASLERPLAEATLGEGYTIYVYNHDIAADIGTE